MKCFLRCFFFINLCLSLCFINTLAYGQKIDDNGSDTLHFKGFSGINYCAEHLIPTYDEIYRVRYKPNLNIIRRVEREIKKKYVEATEMFLENQFYEAQKDTAAFNWPVYVEQFNNSKPKILLHAKNEMKQNYTSYDREYYGFVFGNERGVLIKFKPHILNIVTSGGEGHIDNLPPLVYNIDEKLLSYAGTPWCSKCSAGNR